MWDHGQPTLLPISDALVFARAVNRQGMVVGGASSIAMSPEAPQSVSTYPWAYANGVLQRLPIPHGYVGAGAFAINDRGDIAGEALKSNGQRVAVVWAAGAGHPATVLSAPRNSSAQDVTSYGVVVGFGDGIQPLLGHGDINDVAPHPYAWYPDRSVPALQMPPGRTLGW